MSEELGRNERWVLLNEFGAIIIESTIEAECWRYYDDHEGAQRGFRVAKATHIESAALAKVREALDLLLRWDACDHGNDDQWEIDELYHLMLNTAKEALALLEPPQ